MLKDNILLVEETLNSKLIQFLLINKNCLYFITLIYVYPQREYLFKINIPFHSMEPNTNVWNDISSLSYERNTFKDCVYIKQIYIYYEA